MLHSPDDSRLTPEQRRREIAAILARGVLRSRSMLGVPPESTAPDSDDAPPENGLDVSATSRPHVTGS